VRAESRRFFDAGLSALDAAKRLDLGPYARWTEPERLLFNVERAYREFRGEPFDAPIGRDGDLPWHARAARRAAPRGRRRRVRPHAEQTHGTDAHADRDNRPAPARRCRAVIDVTARTPADALTKCRIRATRCPRVACGRRRSRAGHHSRRVPRRHLPVAGRDRHALWWSPDPRAVLPLDGMHVSRQPAAARSGAARSAARCASRRTARSTDVIAACAESPGRHLDHVRDAGRVCAPARSSAWAHSVEVWDGDRLAGGLYGVAVGGFFAAESMFHHVRDASKVALAALVERLHGRGFMLLDVQLRTPHLASLGVVEVPRLEYLRRLAAALGAASRVLALAQRKNNERHHDEDRHEDADRVGHVTEEARHAYAVVLGDRSP